MGKPSSGTGDLGYRLSKAANINKLLIQRQELDLRPLGRMRRCV